MTDTAAKDGLNAALLAVQADAPKIRKDATNPHFKSRFASLEGIVETINPILHRHGLVWSTLPCHNEYGPALRYRLAHTPTGEVLEDTMPLLMSKQDAQGQGSAITYARRYALCAVLNLVADDDDDGNAAGQGAGRTSGSYGRPNQNQLKYLQNLVKEKVTHPLQVRTMLDDLGANTVEVAAGWPSKLTGSQVSLLIDRLKDGELPPAPEQAA